MISMRKRFERLVFGFLAVVCLWSSSAEAKDYKLYYLGGQSNMDGFGYVMVKEADCRTCVNESVEDVIMNTKEETLRNDRSVKDGRGARQYCVIG